MPYKTEGTETEEDLNISPYKTEDGYKTEVTDLA